MLSLTKLLTTISLLHLTLSYPLVVPIGTTGSSISISEDGSISLDGQAIDMPAQYKTHHQQQPKPNPSPCNPATGTSTSPIPQADTNANAKAVYFITNNAENSVVALKVGADGMLSDGSITPTGGKGGSGVDATGITTPQDGLFSQGSVRVDGGYLFAVNSVSNTLSMFSISPQDPSKLTPLGTPIPTLGEFPTSVATSTKLSMACVASTGRLAGISCFKFSSSGLAPLDNTLRPFELNQSTPPSGPFNTVSHTFFNSDSTALLTTVKGNPMVNNTGFLSIFPVQGGSLAMKDNRSSPNGTAVLFGSALIPGSPDKIFATDASFGATTLSISPDFSKSSSLTATKIDGQKATCWSTVSALTKTAFITDVGKNTLVEVDTQTGDIVSNLVGTNGNAGMIDLNAKGGFVYALAPGTNGTTSKVAVFDVTGGRGSVKQVQNFELKGAGIGGSVQGMGIL